MKVIEVVKDFQKRYICVDVNTGEIIDDAQGYGYKTKKKAYSAYSYKYGKGKNKQIEYKKFWQEHKDIAKFINDFHRMWFKEIARGEITEEELLFKIKEKYNIDISRQLLKHHNYIIKK